MTTAIIEDGFSAVLTPDFQPAATFNERSDDDYLIEALAKGLLVLEALKGHAYEPVTISYISKQTKLSYDFCRRAIKTLKVKGWAIEDDRGFRLSVKAMQFSEDFLKWAASLKGMATCPWCEKTFVTRPAAAEGFHKMES